jgi:polyhydroxyalkanoate synthesis regulator phasin
MTRIIFSLMILTVCAALPVSAQYGKSERRKTAKTASELSSMAREIRVSRAVRERLEDYARIIQYAVKSEQFSPAELRRVQGVLNRIEKMLDRVNKSGKMSQGEAQAMYRELSRAYRQMWFMRRNKLGKECKIVFLGRQIVLREEYQRKFQNNSLNQKEMQEILHAYYSACRVREQLRTDDIQPKVRHRLEKECFQLLSDYFTLAPEENKVPAEKTGRQPERKDP